MSKQTELRSPDEKFEALGNMTQSIEERFIELGQLFAEIKISKLYRFKGYEKFGDFVESEFRFSKTLANKLVAVYEFFIDEMDMDEETAKEIGFDRLSMIKPVIIKGDWKLREEWIQKAQDMPTKDLRVEIKALKEQTKAEDPDMKQVLIDQMKERVMLEFNCSWAEATFKLALLISAVSTDQLHDVKAQVKDLQMRFEQESNQGGDNAKGTD